MLWLSCREVFWIICLGQSRILSVEWYPSTWWRLAVSYWSFIATSLRWASQKPPRPSSLFPGDSPLALCRTPRVKLMHCFLCSHCFCQGFPPAVPSLEIQPFSCPRVHATSQPFPTRFLNALGCFQRWATRDGLREAEQTDTTKGHALKMRWPGR